MLGSCHMHYFILFYLIYTCTINKGLAPFVNFTQVVKLKFLEKDKERKRENEKLATATTRARARAESK